MDRRTFVGITAALISAHLSATGAPPPTARRIGFLGNGKPDTNAPQHEAFKKGLRDLGWIEGGNIVFEYGWAEGSVERLPALVAAFLQRPVDIIVLSGSPALSVAHRATRTTPIVFIVLTDPVALGFVASFARPGGNITGMASQFEELITKQLQLLREAIPRLSRVALLHQAGLPAVVLTAAETTTRALGLTAHMLKVNEWSELDNAFKTASAERAGAMLVLPSPYFDTQSKILIALAARYRLPAFYEFKNFVENGGLMSYGPNINEMYARAASYVDRILKGAYPGDLAIERPRTFELVINLKTAATLGLSLPASLLERADQLIG